MCYLRKGSNCFGPNEGYFEKFVLKRRKIDLGEHCEFFVLKSSTQVFSSFN